MFWGPVIPKFSHAKKRIIFESTKFIVKKMCFLA